MKDNFNCNVKKIIDKNQVKNWVLFLSDEISKILRFYLSENFIKIKSETADLKSETLRRTTSGKNVDQ